MKGVSVVKVYHTTTLSERWYEHVFISGGNIHLTNQFFVVKLDPTTQILRSGVRHVTDMILTDTCDYVQ